MSNRTRPRATADRAHASLDAPEPPVELWASLVRHARRSRRLSQTQLAVAAGVTQQSISKIEQADICPHDRLKLRLAVALDVPPSDLFPWPRAAAEPTPTAALVDAAAR